MDLPALLISLFIILSSVWSQPRDCKPSCAADVLSKPLAFDPVTKYIIPKDNSCRLHAFPYLDSVECLKGSWTIFIGGSVTHVLARRIASYFKTKAQDSAYTNFNKSIRGRVYVSRNMDMIFTDSLSKTVQFEAIASLNGVGEDAAGLQVIKFMESANAHHLSAPSPKTIDMRITMIQDRYLYTPIALSKHLHKLVHRMRGITKVYLIIGPIGKWFSLCEPAEIKLNPGWACGDKLLKGKTPEQLLEIYQASWSRTLGALVAARRTGALTQAMILAFRNPWEQQIGIAYAALKSSLASQSPNAAHLMPLYQNQFYSNWFSNPLALSLQPQPYYEVFQGHPTGTSAYWYYMVILAGICNTSNVSRRGVLGKGDHASIPRGDAGCPHRPIFSRQCWGLSMEQAPTKVPGKPLAWQDGLEIKGCKISSMPYPAPKLGFTLGNAGYLGKRNGRPKEPATVGLEKQWGPDVMISLMMIAIASLATVVYLVWREYAAIPSMAASVPHPIDDKEKLVSHTTSPSTPTTLAVTGRIDSLVFSRYISSLHVVAGHLYAKGYSMTTLAALQPVLPWGFTWVPFFFMLSGFVLTYVKIMGVSPYMEQTQQRASLDKKLETPLEFVYKRSINTYPLYLCGLFLSAGLSWLAGTPSAAAGSAFNVLSQALLLQSWLPTIEHTLQAHCWFISCEAAYWATFPFLVRFFLDWSLPALIGLIIVVPLALVMFLFLLPLLLSLPPDWATMHLQGSSISLWSIDHLMVVLKFSPICYFHLFGAGVVSAFIFRYFKFDKVHVPDASEPPMYKRCCYALIKSGACVGYLCLGLIFFIPALRPQFIIPKLSFRLGLLSPLHGLILLGLAANEDILARSFAHPVLQILGNWSYAQFILQFIVYRAFFLLVPDADQSVLLTKLAFFGCLTCSAALAYQFVQFPLRNERRYNWFLLAAALGVVAWVGGCFIGHFWMHVEAPMKAPAFINHGHGCYDVRLNFSMSLPIRNSHQRLLLRESSSETTLAAATSGESGLILLQEGSIINPSILRVGKTLVMAARLHHLEVKRSVTGSGSRTATSVEYRYHSAIVRAELSEDFQQTSSFSVIAPQEPIEPPLSRGENVETTWGTPFAWTPCQTRPVHYAENNTLIATVTTGPQDPRLFLWKGKFVMMTFFSMNPTSKAKVGDARSRSNDGICSGELHGQTYLTEILSPAFSTNSAASALTLSKMQGASTDPRVTAKRVKQGLGPVYEMPVSAMADRPYPVTNPLLARQVKADNDKDKKKKSDQAKFELGLVEKNWLFFDYIGDVYFVYRIYPHVVYKLTVPEKEEIRPKPVKFTGRAELLGDIIYDYGSRDDGLIAHGGAAPIPVSVVGNVTGTYFLSSFHTISAAAPHVYTHYLYLFEPKEFHILAVSSPLPLTGQPANPGSTFISSILQTPTNAGGGYSIFYGSGDKESRVLVLTETVFARLFEHALSQLAKYSF